MIILGLLMCPEKVEEIRMNSTVDAESFQDISIVDLTKPSVALQKVDVVIHNMCDFLSDDKGIQLNSSARDFYNYMLKNTRLIWLDPVGCVENTFDRFRQMDLAKASMESCKMADRVFVPNFCLFETKDAQVNIQRMKENKLQFPIICKPIKAQGDGAHDMAVVFNKAGLNDLQYPIFAQQFINHNAQLFKISVIGEQTITTRRTSIKNFRTSLSNQKTVFFHTFTVSKQGYDSPLTKLDPDDRLRMVVPKEDGNLFHQIAMKIGQDFGLNLFSVDVIECVESELNLNEQTSDLSNIKPRSFAIIDVNPLPSYSNVPNFHHYLGNLIRKKLSLPTIPLRTD